MKSNLIKGCVCKNVSMIKHPYTLRDILTYLFKNTESEFIRVVRYTKRANEYELQTWRVIPCLF